MKNLGRYVFLTSLLLLGAAGYEMYLGNMGASKVLTVVGAGVGFCFYLGMEIAEGFNMVSEIYFEKAAAQRGVPC